MQFSRGMNSILRVSKVVLMLLFIHKTMHAILGLKLTKKKDLKKKDLNRFKLDLLNVKKNTAHLLQILLKCFTYYFYVYAIRAIVLELR